VIPQYWKIEMSQEGIKSMLHSSKAGRTVSLYYRKEKKGESKRQLRVF
jgi:hypothetical protein